MSGWNVAMKIAALTVSALLIAVIAIWDGGSPAIPEVPMDHSLAQACQSYEANGTPCSVVNMGTTVFEVSSNASR